MSPEAPQGSTDPYHFPPELLDQLIEVIPLLNKAKTGVLDFFRGAGVDERHLADLRAQLARDRNSLGKHQIARTVLTRLNEDGDRSLRARREVVKRVAEFEDFSLCWPDDQLPARGLVAAVRDVVNRRDSFTRMRDAEEKQRQARQRELAEKAAEKAAETQRQLDTMRGINDDLCRLFNEANPWRRGKKLEGVLNRWCKAAGILVRDAFTVRGNEGEGVVEQIDGVISLKNEFYLVEMKWHDDALGVDTVGIHLARIFGRADVRGMIISASGFTAPAIATCRDALGRIICVLCELEELVLLSARGGDLASFLGRKAEAAALDRNPFLRLVDG